MNKPKISVIVPVYNAEMYIAGCIQSILSQTFTDFELLLVNDGSKDASGRTCDAYAKRDARLKVVHQENGGVLAARASGIRIAQGDYLYFVDADDKIAPDTLDSMLQYADAKTDIVIFESKQDAIYTMADFAQALLHFKHWTVWGKLYKRKLFDEDSMSISRYFKVGEDFLTNLSVLRNITGEVVCKPISKYLYNSSNPSSVQLSHKHNYEYETSMINAVRQILASLKEYKSIKDARLRWELVYLGGMIGLQYPINRTDDWIIELLQEAKHLQLSMREKVILDAVNKRAFRIPLIMEKKAKAIARSIRRHLTW